jgi:hypothetical protein
MRAYLKLLIIGQVESYGVSALTAGANLEVSAAASDEPRVWARYHYGSYDNTISWENEQETT